MSCDTGTYVPTGAPPLPTVTPATSSTPRRRVLLEATIRLLGREGLAGITHRAVAGEADVPLAATTYYFDSKDALVRDAISLLVGDELTHLRVARAHLGDSELDASRIAAALGAVLAAQFPDPSAALAKFEVYVHAARRDDIRPAALAWTHGFADLAEDVLRAAGAPNARARAETLVAATDGILLHEVLYHPEGLDPERLASSLEPVVSGLLAHA